jgi:hypothetical protein
MFQSSCGGRQRRQLHWGLKQQWQQQQQQEQLGTRPKICDSQACFSTAALVSVQATAHRAHKAGRTW